MTKYYFFKLVRERNAQGEYWAVLHALPRQTTYENWRDMNHPVDVTYKVQLTRTENSKAVQYPAGTVFGVKYESSSARDCRLPVYSRNGVKFYRTENTVFVVSSNGYVRPEHRAPQAFAEAFAALLSSDTAPSAEPAPAPSFSTTPTPQTQPSAQSVAPDVETPNNEMELIEDALRRNMRGSESDILTKLLEISRLRDRMRKGVAKFNFYKQNGDLREAYGTRNREVMSLLHYSGDGQSRGTGNDGDHFCYFDVQKADWRCFCVSDLRDISLVTCIVDAEQIREIHRQFNA